MDIERFLTEITAVPGMSGYEQAVAQALLSAFLPFCDEVSIDAMGSVTAVQHGSARSPRVMFCAHIDEVGLMTTGVEDDGSVRFLSRGVAAQVLPGQEVTLLTREGPLYGVIGAAPLHLMPADKRGEATPDRELFIDTGLAPGEARRRVPVGTPVQLTGKTTPLLNGLVASKTLDDRACVAVLLAMAEEMKRRLHDAEILYVLSAREEFDSLGATTSAQRLKPDLAIVLDVTHGNMEGCAPGETFPLDTSTLVAGPNAHRKLTDFLRGHAQALGLKVKSEVCAGHSGTDAWHVQVAGEGIPCAVLSLPVRYMHTTVETGSVELMRQQAHWLSQAVAAMNEGWEEGLCF